MVRTKRTVACGRLVVAAFALVAAAACVDRPPRTTTTTTTTDTSGTTTTTDPSGTTTTTIGGGGYTHGPDPTDQTLRAARGPYAITSTRVARGNGFGGGTISYPNDNLGRLGAMVVVPGFMSPESSIAWYGPRIASHGFVVLTIATNSTGDTVSSRATQQNAALRWLTTSSPVAARTDPTRLAAGGWSMGGGGSLTAAQSNQNIKAIIPMAAWAPGSQFRYATPTLLVSCSSDAVAGNASNSNVFYGSLTGPKAQLTMSGGHSCPTMTNATIGRQAVAWLKRYLDQDTRYSSFACPATAPSGAASWRSAC
jgi:hypothetical protein